MAKRKLTNYFLYRRRYGVTVGLVFVALVVFLIGAYAIPNGLTPDEQVSSVRALRLDQLIAVNAPYYWLQKASIALFGLSTFSIKLPSLFFGLLVGVSVFFLFRRWLAPATAVFGSLLLFSGATFLSLAGTGSPQILYVAYPALLLFFGTRVLAHDRGLVVFTLLLLVTIALALLTPTLVYLLILALVIAAFNPHVRYGFRRLPFYGLGALIICFVATLAPVGYLVIHDPSVIKTLLAVPASISPNGLLTNLGTTGLLFGRFLDPGLSNGMIVPLIGLPVAGLTLIGLYRTIKGGYSARAQFLLGWSVIALIIVVLEPHYAILLYLPVVLFAAFGLGQLIAIWYRTFPLNPYARVTAMLPLAVLLAGIVIGSSLRYINTTLYASGSAELYSHDLQILQAYAKTPDYAANTPLAVAPSDLAFYSGLRHVGKFGTQVFIPVTDITHARKSGPLISSEPITSRGVPARIITDGRLNNADRFYVYR